MYFYHSHTKLLAKADLNLDATANPVYPNSAFLSSTAVRQADNTNKSTAGSFFSRHCYCN